MRSSSARSGTRSLVDVAGVAIVVVLAALAYLPGLTTATLLPDELVYLEAGPALLRGESGVNPEHPPLAKLLFGLAQTVVPDPVLAVRLAGVVAGLVIAAVLAVLVARVAGRGWGTAAAGAWVALPHALRSPDGAVGGFDKLDRYGMLDPVATALAVAALLPAVRWLDDRRPRWLLAAGGLLGLAGAAKLSAFLLVPVVLLAPVLSPVRRARAVAGAWATVLVAVVAGFLLAFVPLGSAAPDALRDVVALQDAHRASGHPIVLGGVLYAEAPWWANLAYQWRDDGPLLALALLAGAVAGAVGGGPGRDVRLLLAGAVVVPAIGLALSPVALPHYRFLWLPPLVALTVLGVRELAARGGSGTAGAVAIAGVVAVVGTATILHTATRDPGDYRRAAELVRRAGADTVLVRGYPRVFGHYARHVELVDELPADAVVLDPKVTARRPADDVERALERGPLRRVTVDRLEVWLVGDAER